jgi:hypothetical protein
MRVGLTSPLLVLFFVALHGAAIFLFLDGFFLTRYEIQTRSQCAHPPSSSYASPAAAAAGTTRRHASAPAEAPAAREDESLGRPPSAGTGEEGPTAPPPPPPSSCWMPRRFKRSLFVIVDALRFDFTLTSAPANPADGEQQQQDDYYVNNLPVINELLLHNASNTLLFRFVADAPTTTLQRLKALNTGGIPTFLEAKNNFDSSELSEDNLIGQLRDNGRGTIFMGDDTWAKLFPPHKRYFTRCHPFPSFNVKDLHTVDDGVMQHLFPEMRNEPAAGACAIAIRLRSLPSLSRFVLLLLISLRERSSQDGSRSLSLDLRGIVAHRGRSGLGGDRGALPRCGSRRPPLRSFPSANASEAPTDERHSAAGTGRHTSFHRCSFGRLLTAQCGVSDCLLRRSSLTPRSSTPWKRTRSCS